MAIYISYIYIYTLHIIAQYGADVKAETNIYIRMFSLFIWQLKMVKHLMNGHKGAGSTENDMVLQPISARLYFA